MIQVVYASSVSQSFTPNEIEFFICLARSRYENETTLDFGENAEFHFEARSLTGVYDGAKDLVGWIKHAHHSNKIIVLAIAGRLLKEAAHKYTTEEFETAVDLLGWSDAYRMLVLQYDG
jgi:hypothetical protein